LRLAASKSTSSRPIAIYPVPLFVPSTKRVPSNFFPTGIAYSRSIATASIALSAEAYTPYLRESIAS